MNAFQSRLLPGFFLLAAAFGVPAAAQASDDAGGYPWVIAYYLCFDNELSPQAEALMNGLQQGLISGNTVVLIQADTKDGDKMKRLSLKLSRGRLDRSEQKLGTDESADEGEFGKFLDWVRINWQAKNYALVIAGPGGKLNDLCPDESSQRSLPADKAGALLSSLNEKLGGRIRLLFLRSSGSAALEKLFNFAGAADYLLASPLKLDGPGSYYSEMLRTPAFRPELSGADLASAIMENDRDYGFYTLVNGGELKSLPQKLGPVLDALVASAGPLAADSLLKTWAFEDENNYDAGSFFEAVTPKDKPEAAQASADFLKWYLSALVARRSRGPRREDAEARYSGLSVYAPSFAEAEQRYSALPLYQKSKLEALMRVVTQGAVAKQAESSPTLSISAGK